MRAWENCSWAGGVLGGHRPMTGRMPAEGGHAELVQALWRILCSRFTYLRNSLRLGLLLLWRNHDLVLSYIKCLPCFGRLTVIHGGGRENELRVGGRGWYRARYAGLEYSGSGRVLSGGLFNWRASQASCGSRKHRVSRRSRLSSVPEVGLSVNSLTQSGFEVL